MLHVIHILDEFLLKIKDIPHRIVHISYEDNIVQIRAWQEFSMKIYKIEVKNSKEVEDIIKNLKENKDVATTKSV